jgi:hypothetical protein
MIRVDTSAWVEYDRATGSPVDTRLTELIATADDDLERVAAVTRIAQDTG